jgi:3-phenylpropionate/trans-cinnamate dioxygenase ferredoxin reductase subunit
MPTQQTFVIVGASLAGAKAAEALREEGFEGRIVLIGAERERPYERPPLSKDYLRGESPREKAYVHAEGFYSENEIELRTSTPVSAIDTTSREVVLEGGERVRFDRLLLATGAEPRRLSVPGAELDGVLYLRDFEDADAIAQRLRHGGKLVVIGAGWIGAEVGASARERGLEVTIVEQASVPLEHVLGPEVGAIYRDIHTDHGVELLTAAGLEAFEGEQRVQRVRLAGRALECDFAVVGIGVTPRTQLAEAAGLGIDNGIAVSDMLETSVPGVFAAGDVANAWHPFYGRRIRVEHWANALNQGPAAARSMLGEAEPYERIPYFFSDQYDVGMEYTGYATSWDEVVFRGDPRTRKFIAFWLERGRVLAGMNVNVWEVTEHVQALIRSRESVDVARLRDPDVPLEELAARPVLRHPGRRSAVGASARELLTQGATFARRFVGDRLRKRDTAPLSELASGEGRILQVDGEKLAVSRDEGGALHALSPVCTHLGCLVEFNGAERTWDCPCHGSRFDRDGHVMQGPANRGLERRELS